MSVRSPFPVPSPEASPVASSPLPDSTFAMLPPQHVEAATHRAWPALINREAGPWTLRFAEGYSKRSNSAWIVQDLPPDRLPHALNALNDVECAYAEAGQPAIFKIPDFLPPELDMALDQKGYDRQDTTLVLLRPLDGSCAAPMPSRPRVSPSNIATKGMDCRFELREPDRWFPGWKECAGNPEHTETHAKLLRLAAPGTLFGSVTRRQTPASCGLGVPDSLFPLFGIFDVVTRANLRRQGHASRLMRELLRGAIRLNATHAYLQVVAHNTPARELYASMGFHEAYRYWYRVGPAPEIRQTDS